ncbi:perilipin 6 [Anguilla anguilla]|uniref:perilipin 6 n=1 Tax=Anguilla anguilla TaxID=7936 RepID=UPI0015A7A0CD|nr:perilipin 6 [Anguilla anguilla]
MSQSVHQDSEWVQENVAGRIVRLPLLSSVLQMVSSAYADAKGRYALVGLVGGVAEDSVRSVSQAAARQATPLLQRLEPQIRVANSFASVGLDQLEKRVPILHQSVEEVMGHLKDALFLTLDDVQLRVNAELDRIRDGVERLVGGTQNALGVTLRTSVALGIDNLLTYSEEAADYFLHLPPDLQGELELRRQEYEDENDEEEPGMWTRVRSLQLWLNLYLYHRALLLMASLQPIQYILGGLSDTMGLTQLVEAVIRLSRRLMTFTVARGHQLVALKDAVVSQLSEVIRMALELPPISRALDNLAVFLSDLQELSKLLLQLLINTTPLYNMLQKPAEQQLEDYLIQEYLSESDSSRRASVNSLLLKTPDGRPRRRRSLYSRFRRGSSGANPSDGRRGSLKQQDSLPAPPPEVDATPDPSAGAARRRSSATEALLAPIKQLVSQGQRALEYLSPAPHPEDTGAPVEEASEP